MYHRLHSLPPRGGSIAERCSSAGDRTDTGLHCARCMVVGGRDLHPRWLWSGEESGWDRGIPSVRLLRWPRVFVLH